MGTQTRSGEITSSLFGKTRRAVLALFYGRPDESFYLRQIVRSIGLGQGTVQRELARLSESGILTRTEQGRQVYYQANRNSPVFQELKSLMVKTAGGADILKSALKGIAGRIRSAFIYGSFASGTYTKTSDMDLMVIGDVSFGETVTALAPARKILAREVNVSVYPPEEFQEKIRKGHHFLKTILKVLKVFLIGNKHEFEKLASKRLAR